MLGQFLVTAVQNHIVPGVGQRGRFAVVRDQQSCDAAEVVECMDMAVQPVLGFHVVAGFCVGVVTAWQNGDKQVGCTLFTRDRVLEGNGISGPIYLHGISRLVLDAHGRLCNARPAPVPFAKLSAHVRFLADLMALRTVFFPQQHQGHTRPGQFTVDVRIVGFGVLTGCLVLVWEEKLFEFGVGDVVGEGPGYASLTCCPQYIPHCMSGTVCH